MRELKFVHHINDRVVVYEYTDGTFKTLGYIVKTRTQGWIFQPKREHGKYTKYINLKLNELNK